jgi:hypothetical protein
MATICETNFFALALARGRYLQRYLQRHLRRYLQRLLSLVLLHFPSIQN